MPATLQLRLIPAAAAAPVEAQAGFLPGSDVAAWLEEMARHPGARCFVVPDSVENADAGGLLILPAAGKTQPRFGPRVIPCGVEHGRVAVPSGMRLDPRLSVEEVARLLTYDTYFFHPALGLVAFEPADAITPERLIVPPLLRGTSWLGARAGPTQPPRLQQVMLMLPADDAGMFGAAAQDIGTSSPKDLQSKAPLGEQLGDKLKGGLAGVGTGILLGVGAVVGGIGALVSGGASSSSGGKGKGTSALDRLQQWTAEQLEKLQQQRESEIQRLLKMLDKDPERGLRFALPFGGDASRGVATPGGSLFERNPTYGARGGSGPADMWNFSDQARLALQQKYRDLANRELAEGRFDRAAYIFAELLGDWFSAAGALVRGRKFHEAARIYITRLKNKAQAAKCLEDGGLLADAVLLYAELGNHEKCGDLLRLLGREREAVTAYQEAMKGGSDRLKDARILFDKLQQHELALAVLASGYPHSAQAAGCLEKHFEYLERLNASDAAVALASSLAEPARQLPDAALMARTLHAIHRARLDPGVQGRVATVAIGVIGSGLITSPKSERDLLKLLPDFAASDRLLRRDASRYLDLRQRRRPPVPSAITSHGMMRPCGTIRLPQDGTQWRHLLSRGEKTWLAAGHHAKTSQDVWVMGQGEKIIGKLTSASGWESQLDLLPVLPPLPEVTWLPFARKGEHPRYGRARAADFSFVPDSREQLLANLAWLPHGLLAVHPVANGTWALQRNSTETIDLSFYTYEGLLTRTHALGWAPPALAVPLQMVAHGEEVFITAGAHFLHVTGGVVAHAIELPGSTLHLTVTRPTQPAAVLACAGHEVVLYAPGKKRESVQLFCSRDSTPHACFLADGRIAAGDSSGILVYSAYPEPRQVASVIITGGEKRQVAALAASGPHGLAVLRADGAIECHE